MGTARQALRPGCEELAARIAEDNSADGSAAPGHKSPRWSAERRASYVTGREAPCKRLVCRVMAGLTGAQRSIGAPVGAPPTPQRWVQVSPTRAPTRRGNEFCCLTSEDRIGASSGRWCYATRCWLLRPSPLAGEGQDDGEANHDRVRGVFFAKKSPSPIRIRVSTETPSPARGEGENAPACPQSWTYRRRVRGAGPPATSRRGYPGKTRGLLQQCPVGSRGRARCD